MLAPVKSVTTELRKDAMLPLRGAKGRTVQCLEGAVWITQDHDRNDTVLEPGQGFELDRSGKAIILALRASRILLTHRPRRKAFARRKSSRSGGFWKTLFQRRETGGLAAGGALAIEVRLDERGGRRGDVARRAAHAERDDGGLRALHEEEEVVGE